MEHDNAKTDILIVGGGMVGATAAVGFAQSGYSVTLIEPELPSPHQASDIPDMRVSALNLRTEALLERLGILPGLLTKPHRHYDRLSVAERSGKETTFAARDIQQAYLGLFVENKCLQQSALELLTREYKSSVRIIAEKRCTQLDTKGHFIQLDDDERIYASCMIAADGARSWLRQAASIGVTGWQYQQQANVLLITTAKQVPSCTWQQFTPSGPQALLPLHDNFALLVWYGPSALTKALTGASNAQRKQHLLQDFPCTFGDFEVLEHRSFPLLRQHANQYYRNNVVLIGDAAHSINPLAGQGVNLGFKDVNELIAQIDKFGLQNLSSAYSAYERARRADNLLMMSAMDLLYTSFSNDNKVLKSLRNKVFAAVNHVHPIKRGVLAYAAGVS